MSDQIQSIFSRWQNLEGEKERIREDAKELFAEAKGQGLEPKALRLAFRKKVADDEPETDADRALSALVESYLAALSFDAGAKAVRARARARVENIDEFPSEAPKTRPAIASLERPVSVKASAQASPEAGDAGAVQDQCESTAPTISDDDLTLPTYLDRSHPDCIVRA